MTTPQREPYEEYREHGKLHRSDGPAVRYQIGEVEWWLRGRRHRYYGYSQSWGKHWFIRGELVK